jgi:hypothetical protein
VNYELMWMALRHALVEESCDKPENPFYPAVILLMTGMEQYSDLQEKDLAQKQAKRPYIYMVGSHLHKLNEKGNFDWIIDTDDPNWIQHLNEQEAKLKR